MAISMSGTWTFTAQPKYGYANHTATLLSNGKILVAGGTGGSGKATELYDPSTNTWVTTGLMNAPHNFDPTATLLSNGKVLLVGGGSVPGFTPAPSTTAELYDPTTGTWTYTSAMQAVHNDHTATLLQDGRVMIAGGGGSAPYVNKIAEIYDPAQNTWTMTNTSLGYPRTNHTATLQSDGSVLLIGGSGTDDSGLFYSAATAELYAPVAAAGGAIVWTTAMMSPTIGHIHHTATDLGGSILLVGGAGTPSSTAEFYSFGGSTSDGGILFTPRTNHTATFLPTTGQVLVVGGGNSGSETASVEIYDAWNSQRGISNAWTLLNPMNLPRTNHTATLLPNGWVLVIGGTGNATTGITGPTTTLPDGTQTAPSLTTVTVARSAEYFVSG